MIDQIFSWSTLLTVVDLTGFWLAGKKVWWCWYINIACQGLWFTYAIVSDQYGFVLGAIFYSIVFGKNAIAWSKEHHAGQLQASQPIAHVTDVVENAAGISIGFKFNDANFADNMRRISDVSLTGISIFSKPPAKNKWRKRLRWGRR